MYFIKINATESTNTYLKNLANEVNLENFTIVSANKQSNGKGQMGSIWLSEEGKNLTFSVLLKNIIAQIPTVFMLNKVVAISLAQFLKKLEIVNVKIKWPNDILTGSKKIAGVLIENIFKHNNSIDCIVGIGLNVNQTQFDKLPHATSIALEKNKLFDLQELLVDFCEVFRDNLVFYQNNQNLIDVHYNMNLFKKDKPAVFENKEGKKFMGIIQGVDEHGSLVIELENDVFKKFKLKEIKMVF